MTNIPVVTDYLQTVGDSISILLEIVSVLSVLVLVKLFMDLFSHEHLAKLAKLLKMDNENAMCVISS